MPALHNGSSSSASSSASTLAPGPVKPPGDPSSTTYQPLGTPKRGPSGSTVVQQVTLPIPIGPVALHTAQDIEHARSAAQFDPARIEEIIRDGRIDNDSRRKIITALDKDEVFGDWKKRV
jgi:acyl-CoA oxidase